MANMNNGLAAPTMFYEIRDVLNKYSAENESNTADYILAQFLLDCLAAFNAAQKAKVACGGHKGGK